MNKNDKKKFNIKDISKETWKDIAAWSIVIFGLILVAIGIGFGIYQMAAEAIDNPSMTGIPTLKLSFSLFIATLIAFGIIFLAVYFLLWEKIDKSLDTRKKNVQANISIAKYKAAQAEKNLSASEEEIKNAKVQGKEIVSESKKEGSQVKKEIIDEAKEQGETLMVQTREQIQREKKQMEDEIRKEILETSLLAAEKIIEKELDAEANKKMIEELINTLSK